MNDPIEPQYRARMNDIGRLLDVHLNGDSRPREHGFVLLMFGFGSDKRMNYISNADREDMLCALREMIAIFEVRAPDAIGHS